MDSEVVEYTACPACGQAVRATVVQSGGEPIRMTAHVDAGDDPATRCRFDGGPFLGGPKRQEKFPGDTYL